MNIFFSWSGARSKAVAEAFNWWLPKVIQSVDPLFSSDIEKGAHWPAEIATNLESSRMGIIFLTADNLSAPWILFEAGAMSKTPDAQVCTFLLDIPAASVVPPLGHFQHTLFDKADVRRLLGTVARQVTAADERAPDAPELNETYEVWWPKLEERLRSIPSGSVIVHQRDIREMLGEVLETVRALSRESTDSSVLGDVVAPSLSDDNENSKWLLPGKRVRHPQFGVGTVVSAKALDEDAQVVVRFSHVGVKTLRAAFARLEPV